MNKRHWIGYPVAAALAFGIGASAGGDVTTTATGPTPSVSTTAAQSAPTVTTTKTVTTPGPTVTITATPTVTKTVAVEPPPPAAAFPGDGTFEVGVDIQPGTYVSAPSSSGNCYWARLSGSDGFDNIIANNNSAGQSLVKIDKKDKFFESSGCSAWVKR